jgi:excisionase family DNA binding protein
MAKMFYTTEEAAQKLGLSVDGLKQLVTDNKLREFRDGARVMFKVDQVDKVAGDKGGTKAGSAAGIGLSDSGIALSPKDSSASDVISLADSSAPATTAKEDTVVTGQGVNVFESGEIKPTEAAAQTQIQSAIDDQLSLEGVGSGSGLLDLTRESDDTSLGAELLDEIYPGGNQSKSESGVGSSSGIFEQSATAESSGPSGLENMATAAVGAPVGVAEVVEEADASSGAFGGMALAAVLIMGLTLLIAGAGLQKFTPSWVDPISADMTKILIFAVILVVLSGLFAGVGFFVGKATTR